MSDIQDRLMGDGTGKTQRTTSLVKITQQSVKPVVQPAPAEDVEFETQRRYVDLETNEFDRLDRATKDKKLSFGVFLEAAWLVLPEHPDILRAVWDKAAQLRQQRLLHAQKKRLKTATENMQRKMEGLEW